MTNVNYITALMELEQKQLISNSVQQEFPDNIGKLSEHDLKVEHSLRKDFCGERAFTIDGEDSKDMDDAICVQKTYYGYRLSVHIADVSSFITPGSKLDDIAIHRATSVYLPNVTLPMLPSVLSENLCSLNPLVERNTISVIMKINRKGDLLDTEIVKGKIRSRVKGIYSEVNLLIKKSGDIGMRKKYQEIIEDLPTMVRLYQILRQARINRGALSENSNLPKVILKCDSIELVPVKRGVAENMIEEYMVMCNYAVAKFMREHKLPVIYRVQNVKNQMAYYTTSSIHHAELELDYYLHFTSPIRRLCDLKVHQILSMYLNGYNAKEIHTIFDDNLPEVCELATKRSRTAKQIQESCLKLCCMLFFAQHSRERYYGIVVGYDRNHNPLISIQDYGIPVSVRSAKKISVGERYTFNIVTCHKQNALIANNLKRIPA